MRKRCRTGYDVAMAKYGAGTVYQLPSGKWVGQWSGGRDEYGNRIRGTTHPQPTEAAARRALNEERGKSSSGKPRRGGETVAAFLERWLADVVTVRRRERTLVGYRSIVDHHLVPAFGDREVRALTRREVQAWVARSEGAPLSIRHRVDCLRAALAWAVKWGLIDTNPATGLDLPAVRRPTIRAMTDEQAEAIIAATAEAWHGPIVALALYTGLRQGELLGLRWEDVDLKRERLTVTHSLSRLPGRHGLRYVLTEPKSAKSRRTVPLIPDAVEVLRTLQREQLTGTGSWKGLVFSRRDRPVDGPSLTRDFQASLEAAEVPTMRFHDLRHGTGSLLLSKGVPMAVVSDILGHSSITVTVDIYGHLTEDTKREAMMRIARRAAI